MDENTQPQIPQQPPYQPTPPAGPESVEGQAPKSRGWLKWVLLVLIISLLSSSATYFVLQSKQNQLQNQSPKPLPSHPPDLTASWKAYSNSEVGFSLRYPPDLDIREGATQTFDQKNISFSRDDENFAVAISAISKREVIEKWIRQLYDSNPQTPKFTTKEIMLGSIKATEYFGCAGVEGCQDTYFILIQRDNKIYEISYNVPHVRPNLYMQILSTFQFTN